ncbi:hypothetical protein AK830_g11795 [Neonectria ditissima]|uniref:Uncharacterized protein n=1 Tax=Neonectria ditissima TaxID=78410 RepID=A0A0P7ALC6_9HYPO|nr:hypothetical protein AK830_g11795 [Neonectria ditissima]
MEFVGQVKDLKTEDIRAAANLLVGPTGECTVRIMGRNPHLHADLRSNHNMRQVPFALGTQGIALSSRIEAPPSFESASTPMEIEDEEAECAGCGQLIGCLSARDNGFMPGCPRCNTIRHDVKRCEAIQDMGMINKIDLLLVKRANMPPFNGDEPWFRLFKKFHRSNQDQGVPMRFPWSRQFAKSKLQDVGSLQAELDNHHDQSRLLVDPATKDWQSVITTFFTPRVDPLAAAVAISPEQRSIFSQLRRELVDNSP